MGPECWARSFGPSRVAALRSGLFMWQESAHSWGQVTALQSVTANSDTMPLCFLSWVWKWQPVG